MCFDLGKTWVNSLLGVLKWQKKCINKIIIIMTNWSKYFGLWNLKVEIEARLVTWINNTNKIHFKYDF